MLFDTDPTVAMKGGSQSCFAKNLEFLNSEICIVDFLFREIIGCNLVFVQMYRSIGFVTVVGFQSLPPLLLPIADPAYRETSSFSAALLYFADGAHCD